MSWVQFLQTNLPILPLQDQGRILYATKSIRHFGVGPFLQLDSLCPERYDGPISQSTNRDDGPRYSSWNPWRVVLVADTSTTPYMGDSNANLETEHLGALDFCWSDNERLISAQEDDFAEENNAWVIWVVRPTLCYYTPIATWTEANLQVLRPRPRADTTECDNVLPLRGTP